MRVSLLVQIQYIALTSVKNIEYRENGGII